MKNTFWRSPSATSAGDFISNRLVTFRSVTELQEQNIKLLGNLRELTEKLEEAERAAVEKQTQEIQDELDQTRSQLDELREERDRQHSFIENLTRQRDSYRSLAQQQSPRKGTPSYAPQTPTTPTTPKDGNEKLQIQYDNAQKEIATLKKAHDEYCTEKAKNDKLIQGELERMRASSEKAV